MIVYMVFTYVIHTERYMKILYIEIYGKYVIGARDTGDVRPATRDVRPADLTLRSTDMAQSVPVGT